MQNYGDGEKAAAFLRNPHHVPERIPKIHGCFCLETARREARHSLTCNGTHLATAGIRLTTAKMWLTSAGIRLAAAGTRLTAADS
jgi:hypothetical protein